MPLNPNLVVEGRSFRLGLINRLQEWNHGSTHRSLVRTKKAHRIEETTRRNTVPHIAELRPGAEKARLRYIQNASRRATVRLCQTGQICITTDH